MRRLDGSMSVPQRAGELARFRADAAVPAMLFSLLAGSTGLNLTARCAAAPACLALTLTLQCMSAGSARLE